MLSRLVLVVATAGLLVGGTARPASARDLILVGDATSNDVRLIESTGALVNGIRTDGVAAEASTTEQDALTRLGFTVSIVTPHIDGVYADNFRGPADDAHYLTYTQFLDTMESIAANNPSICRLETLGTSYGGNLLLAMKVSANPGIHENEPAVHFEADIHGDERIGWAVTFEMLRYVVSNYPSDTLVARLVDTRELWFLPMYNPDGYIAGNRYNGNSVDLNRNWGWMWGWEYNMGTAPFSEPENRAVLGHILRHPFTVFVSYHAGTEFVSYSWSCSGDNAPEKSFLDFLSQRYVIPNGYEYGQGYQGMYPINGSTKDYDYGQGMMGWSIEVHNLKTPPAESIPPVFDRNRPAILEFCHRAGQGIHGTITDSADGRPVHAQIWVSPAEWPSFNDTSLGDYHRFCLPGTYDVTYRAPGFRDTTLHGVIVPNSGDSALALDIRMNPDASAPLFGYRMTYCYSEPASYDADPRANTVLGPHDGVAYPLTTSRRLCVDMDRPVHNRPGTDLTVYRPTGSGTAAIKGSDSWQGPWTTIGVANSAQTDFDLSSVGLDSVRYIELTSSGTFNLDAVEGANDYVGVAEDSQTARGSRSPVLRANSPARGNVIFRLEPLPPNGARLTIRDVSGRLVSSFGIRSASFAAPVGMPAGVYFATLNSDNAAPTQFVVMR